MAAIAKLRADVDAFFDKVTVNVPAADRRENRLKLLNEIREATRRRCGLLEDRGDASRPAPARLIRMASAVATGQHQLTSARAIVALVAGILILVMPRLLNYIVAIYLIMVGIIGLGIIK